MLKIIWGNTLEKPVSSQSLADSLFTSLDDGYLYLGYPVIASPIGPIKLDAILLSPKHGLVAFHLVEGTELGDYEAHQDEIASMLEVRLKPYPDLKQRRNLLFAINVVTFAPAKATLPKAEAPYFLVNRDGLSTCVEKFSWESSDLVFAKLLSAIQVVTSIRAGKQKRDPKNPNSLGARLKLLEESIANLDQHQSQAVVETVEGVQRIRGLAGSGKTIVLALKVAYLHAQNPGWRIAVTFNTRSLKEQFRRLINGFTIEQTGTEPDWDVISIINAWGGPGDRDREGIYHKFCQAHGIPFYDFIAAKAKFGEGKEFQGACNEALRSAREEIKLFDVILIDEAQDLPPDFLQLSYRLLTAPGRLVYAYDELQSLTGVSVPPPEEIFGLDAEGEPVVRLNHGETGPKQDIILEKCYRNSRPVLSTAHALGFGIYREGGLVQIFDQDSLWSDVGYIVESGDLVGGENVTLARTPASSPDFLEKHSPIEELVQFITFKSAAEQADWLVSAIENDLNSQELKPEDIIVINPNPLTTRREVGPIRKTLFEKRINSDLAGVSTSADVFVKSGSITFTGIFRAKGNEAGMVYIINAQDCASGWDKTASALGRNRLFTAITRSKAWVRVLGVGKNMDVLVGEWEKLRKNDFKLSFRYPTQEEKKQLRVIDRDLAGRSARRQTLQNQRAMLLRAAQNGELDVMVYTYDIPLTVTAFEAGLRRL